MVFGLIYYCYCSGGTGQVNEARIPGCSDSTIPCKMKKGSQASIEFDFTPSDDTTHVSSSLSAIIMGIETPAPKESFDTDACKFIKGAQNCALKKNVKYTYSYTMTVPNIKEIGNLKTEFRFRVKDAKDGVIVCFGFPVQLLDP